jgi:carboxypeptidase PM20D1
MPLKRLTLALTVLPGVLVALLVIRTATFSSRQLPPRPARTLQLDQKAIITRLSEAIQIQTVSLDSERQSNDDRFQKFHAFLAKSFPRVHAQLVRETIHGSSLLYTWQGKEEKLKPILLMAHMDVVPVDPATQASWTHGPFSGEVADGYIWGRGTMDDKASVLGILEAVEYLLRSGFTPKRTFYLAFGHDEEIGGRDGAAGIAEHLRARNVKLAFVLDEGMNIFDGLIAGVAAPVALVGIAEKGYLSLRLTVETPGGHSSIPPAETAIGLMSRALERIAAAPFPTRLNGPTQQMLQFLGPEMAWDKKLALANLWLFDPFVRRELAASPLTNALIRTTIAPTIFNAGVKDNVLPSRAIAVVNLRLTPGETLASATRHVRDAISDPRVHIAPLGTQVDPSAVSDITSQGFRSLQQTIGEIAPRALVAPALLVAATDSRHYRSLTSNIFRFLPITLGPKDTQRYHGVDERISIQDYERLVRFYARLIENSSQH